MVTVAAFSGFCFGVERALELVRGVCAEEKRVATFGPIIHNPQVVAALEKEGVRELSAAYEAGKSDTLIIRTHGVEKKAAADLRKRAGKVIDATCPFVAKTHRLAKKLSQHSTLVIVGDAEHPEVRGTVSNAADGEYFIVSTPQEAAALPYRDAYGVLAQTTQNEEIFEQVLAVLKNRCRLLTAENTICDATHKRQKAALNLAEKVDVMLVVGGKNSANTSRLCSLCRSVCPRSYHIESEDDIEDVFLDAENIGITAGASTPIEFVNKVRDYILKRKKMGNNTDYDAGTEELDFEALIEGEGNIRQPLKGDTVTGEITLIQGNEVLVNVGMKTEGLVDRTILPEGIKVGDKLDFVVESFSGGQGFMRLTTSEYYIDRQGSGRDSVGKIVKVKIESKVDKGFRGKVGDNDAFVPETHIDLRSRIQEPSSYIGKTLPAKILRSSGTGRHRSIVVSPKEYLIESTNRERQGFFSRHKTGEKVKGVVKSVRDYGAFISLGGIDGFLHRTNISWGRPKNATKYFQPGDEIEVQIVEMDAKTGKVEVSLKQLQPDPWDSVRERYPAGSSLKASVIGRRRNGYIAEVEPGIDAVIPPEEFSWNKNAHIQIKGVVEGRVLEYDDNHKRITISVKMMSENPWIAIERDTPEGSIVECTIKSITDFGLFVDFGQAIDGLIRKGDISWIDKPEDLHKTFKKGDVLEARILKVDEARQHISLGIKQTGTNPWKELSKTDGSKGVNVTVIGAMKGGIEVLMENGLHGFIPQSELDPDNQELANYTEGLPLNAVVTRTDQKERKIVLSVKKLLAESEKKHTKEILKKLEKSGESQWYGNNVFKDVEEKLKEK
ncbi:MAG: 4-hydroxy-3-methylbut-2-enyl diphosphate reductase [Deferribacteraceae bacterium]|jgi:ribosomal protein S1/(E)-4-hydroxy-3-methyl-but-2-enyl pyrophosphate reductase|nr:4-hydroxy-3-methylbut-2-enyl diphosphate reductase [Deferribacteraceae bacterium]